MSHSQNPGTIERKLLAIKLGAQQVLVAGKTISYLGKSYDSAAIVQLVDALLAPYIKVREMRTMMSAGVVERNGSTVTATDFIRVLQLAAASSYGEHSLEYSQFGFTPKKKAADLTPEQKQHKLESLRATRNARRTMGKRQKQALKGQVDANPATGANGAHATNP
jgi:hypothetical protein